jgi:hypothetical protein
LVLEDNVPLLHFSWNGNGAYFLLRRATWLLAPEMAGYAGASDTGMPEGTIAWLYFTNGMDPEGYAATPEEACELTAKNHMGTLIPTTFPLQTPGHACIANKTATSGGSE